jgi:hypothetical protein
MRREEIAFCKKYPRIFTSNLCAGGEKGPEDARGVRMQIQGILSVNACDKGETIEEIP